jgi:hypothetical protein
MCYDNFAQMSLISIICMELLSNFIKTGCRVLLVYIPEFVVVERSQSFAVFFSET